MRDLHCWEQLRPEEFYAEQSRAPVAYWACGPMEDHGLQNALGVDPGKASEICRRAARLTGGIVFPMVPFAPAGKSSGSASRSKISTQRSNRACSSKLPSEARPTAPGKRRAPARRW